MTPGISAAFTPASVVVTHSWGLQPATALVEWVSQSMPTTLVAGSTVQIDLNGYTFYGLTDNFVSKVATDGSSVLQEFRDNREFLMWDVIYGAFNLPDNRYLNGTYQQRFRHLLPAAWNANGWTWTDTPYTAAQILNFIFGADTVQSPWLPNYHPLMSDPIFGLDYSKGQKLGQCLVDISEKLGLVFTLWGGPYSLYWVLKGTGALPAFPPNSDVRRSGSALSGNPTRVRILGDRNRYQIFNVALEPDWLPAWEDFWDFGAFVNDLFLHEVMDTPMLSGSSGAYLEAGTAYTAIPNDPDHLIGYMLAGARARLLTVGQYAALRDARWGDGAFFRDTRRFQGRSRLQLPVSLYLSQLLFRAFRLNAGFTFKGYSGATLARFGFDLDNNPVVETTHDPVTGFMQPMLDAQGHYEVPSSVSNGYAVVCGYQVGQDAFGTLNPDYFDYQSWISAQQLWQYTPFQADDSGDGDQFVIFDEPVINSGDLILAAENPMPDGRARGVLNADPTFTAPPVKATLTLLGETFSSVCGTGSRDDVENIGGLQGQFLIPQAAGSSALIEMPFSDGMLASSKAQQYGALLLNGQLFYRSGGYLLAGADDGVDLSGAVDRITLRWNAREGLTKEVDWENERSRNVSIGPRGVPTLMLDPEREFDRKSQLDPLFPGQEGLRTEARQLRLDAAVLRASPAMQRALVDTFHLLMGFDTPPTLVLTDSPPTGAAPTLAAGTPLYRTASANVAVTPSDTSTTTYPTMVFMGVTSMHNQSAAAGVRAIQSGVVQARVMGPAAAGAAVGFGTLCHTYLEPGASMAVGTTLEAIATPGVQLIRVRLSTSASGMNWQTPKELDPTVAVASGVYVYISPQNPLVTTGLVDLVSQEPTTARPGIWQAVQAVPAQTIDGQYNVPQIPLPEAGDAPSGTPLSGDADGTDVYWMPWCPTPYC